MHVNRRIDANDISSALTTLCIYDGQITYILDNLPISWTNYLYRGQFTYIVDNLHISWTIYIYRGQLLVYGEHNMGVKS